MITKDTFPVEVGKFYSNFACITEDTNFYTLFNENLPALKKLADYCLEKECDESNIKQASLFHINSSAKDIFRMMTSTMEAELDFDKRRKRMYVYFPLLYNKVIKEQDAQPNIVRLQRKDEFEKGIQFTGKNIAEIEVYTNEKISESSVKTGRLKISDWVIESKTGAWFIKNHEYILEHYNILEIPNKLWKVGKFEILNDAETVELPKEAKGITTTYAGCGTLVIHYLYPA